MLNSSGKRVYAVIGLTAADFPSERREQAKLKRVVDDLALLGGQPEFEAPLHVGRPNIGDRERLRRRIEKILDDRWLTNDGPTVRAFEAELARILGVRECVAIVNGTVALEIAIRALSMEGEVIVPSFTFVATAHALYWQRVTPVFCDMDAESWTLDPARAEELITERTTGIIGVHLWARPCDIDGLQSLARRHGLALLFDASHAVGVTYGGVPIGRFGDAEVFSFHATKFVNSFEGGAIATDNSELAEKIRLMRNFGFETTDKVIHIGTNGKMTEVCAAMGLTSLESIDDFLAVNRANYQRYRDRLADLPGIAVQPYDEQERTNYQYLTIVVDSNQTELSRDTIYQILAHENVLARRYFDPGCHEMEPYASSLPDPALRLPVTERFKERLLCLPTGTAIDDEQIDRIAGVLRFALDNRAEIKRRIPDA